MPVTPDITKKCPKCKLDLEYGKFGKDKRTPTGLKSWCKSCHNAGTRAHYLANKKKIDAKNTAWAKANPEARNKHASNWRARNPEIVKAQKNRWRQANPEKIAEQRKAWNKSNPEKARLYTAIRRARKKSNGVFKVTPEDVSKLLTQGCAYCPSPATTVDHVVPLAKGGSHSIGNLVGSCLDCNLSKGSKFLFEWKRLG